jgi:hypothetical protein
MFNRQARPAPSPCCGAQVDVGHAPDQYGSNSYFVCSKCRKVLSDDYEKDAPAVHRLMKLDLLEPHTVYRVDGKKVPGVTTIRNLIAKEALYRWYHGLGTKGVAWDDVFKYTQADLGTVIHGRAEAYLRGFDGLDPTGLEEHMDQSSAPFLRFLERWKASDFQVVQSELALTSNILKVGGTLDILAQGPHGLTLIDLKSSKPYRDGKWTDLDTSPVVSSEGGRLVAWPRVRPYRDVLVQLGGYSLLWNENHPATPIRRVELWRLGRAEDDPGQVHVIEDVRECEAAFECCVNLYYALIRL